MSPLSLSLAVSCLQQRDSQKAEDCKVPYLNYKTATTQGFRTYKAVSYRHNDPRNNIRMARSVVSKKI